MDPVIVAGAGPVGLTLALALARRDVPVILVDEARVVAGADGLRQARTTVLDQPAVAFLERLGYGGIREDGCTWTGWRTFRRRVDLGRMDFGPRDAPVHLAQDALEEGLRRAVRDCAGIQVVSGCRLDSVEQDPGGVTVHTQGAQATWWRGAFLVGCDGARSAVRKLLGVRFPGRTAVDRHAVVAVRTELPEPGVALLHRDPPGTPSGQEVTARPLPGGLWRLDWQLPVQGRRLTSDALVERLRSVLAAWCGQVPSYELVGSADYPVHQRLARTWRVGRAFLAGDAAHLMGALGAQSIQDGLRDAENLAWKLALAYHDGASDLLLDSYEAERRGAVGARLRATDQALPLLRANGAWRTLRHTLLSGSARGQAEMLTDSHLGRGATAAPVYSRSRLTVPVPRGAAGSPLAVACGTPPGGVVEDVEVTGVDGTAARLRERLGRGLLVVLVAPGTGVWESRHWLTAGLMPRLAAAVAALPVAAELVVAEGYPGATAHTVLLVRPDGHLVTAMIGCRPAELYSYADLARGGPPIPVPPPPADASPPEPPETPEGGPSAPHVGGRLR